MMMLPPVEVELRGAALELFSARDKELLVSGPAGTGKTQAALLKVHLLCLAKPGVRALVVRKTHASLTASTLNTFKKKVAAEAIARHHLSFFGGSASEPAAFRYVNGSVLVVGGLDKPTKLLSTEYDIVLVDEAVETTPDDLDILITRLRNGVLPYQQLVLLTNPDSPYHHLKQRADAGRCRMLYSRHEDNPAYHDGHDWTQAGREYLDRLATLPTLRRQRYLEGKWVAAEGLIYEDFDPAVHLCDPFPGGYPPKDWKRFIAVDFGFRNPFCALWVAVSPDDRLYVYREVYQSGLMTEDAGAEVKKVMDRDTAAPVAIITDHALAERKTLERVIGRGTAIANKESVKQGIEAVQARLRPDAQGNPGLYICRGALVRRDQTLAGARKPTCLQEEITTYVWDMRNEPGGGNPRETPVKEDDHAMDALRYAVMYHDHKKRLKYRSFDTGLSTARRF